MEEGEETARSSPVSHHKGSDLGAAAEGSHPHTLAIPLQEWIFPGVVAWLEEKDRFPVPRAGITPLGSYPASPEGSSY